MMAQDWVDIFREIINCGKFINQFPPVIIKSIRQLKRIKKRNILSKMFIMFNQIHTHTHTHTHTYIYIYIYIYIYLC